MQFSYLLGKLHRKGIWRRIFYERLSEPLHLNIISLFVALFGGTRAKVAYDLLNRPQNAFSLLDAADRAKRLGIGQVTVVEFGVAAGAGLMNLCLLAQKITECTGVKFRVVGFDTGKGMPPPRDYRDHPDRWRAGDYPMVDFAGLKSRLPDFAELIIGDIAETVPLFIKTLTPEAPLGYAIVDVDYYWSTVECLKILTGPADRYLPLTILYVDDILAPDYNEWQGELLAIKEFTAEHAFRKIAPYNLLSTFRLFKRGRWLPQIYSLHVLDHPVKNAERQGPNEVLSNLYLNVHGIDG